MRHRLSQPQHVVDSWSWFRFRLDHIGPLSSNGSGTRESIQANGHIDERQSVPASSDPKVSRGNYLSCRLPSAPFFKFFPKLETKANEKSNKIGPWRQHREKHITSVRKERIFEHRTLSQQRYVKHGRRDDEEVWCQSFFGKNEGIEYLSRRNRQ